MDNRSNPTENRPNPPDNRPNPSNNRSNPPDNRPIPPDNRPVPVDNRAKPIHDLFSRGSTPPVQPYAGSHISSNSSPKQIDSLFHNLTATDQKQPQSHSTVQSSDGHHNSAPVSPAMSMSSDPLASSTSTLTTTASERQNALLSLLSNPSASSNPGTARPPAGAGPPLSQQVPTPPSTSQRPGSSPTHNENQGKILLEQLMSG